jgi:hypothetical protein
VPLLPVLAEPPPEALSSSLSLPHDANPTLSIATANTQVSKFQKFFFLMIVYILKVMK